MKKTTLRFLAAVCTAACLLATLAGCGGNSQNASGNADGDTIKLTMSLVDNTASNYYKGAQKIAELTRPIPAVN